MSWERRRFWKTASSRQDATGFGVNLDDRPLRTPGGALLIVPTLALAEAVAAEWAAIDAVIDPAHLPLTRAANSAIDRVSVDPEPVIDALAAYGATDLLCYRASSPERLLARQCAAWDPWLSWSARTFDAPLISVTGVMHQAQPQGSLKALRAAVARYNGFGLTALHELIALSGSLVLSLAVAEGAIDAGDAWDLARLEEIWQIEQWGTDDEAEAACSGRRETFIRAAELLVMLGNSAFQSPIH